MKALSVVYNYLQLRMDDGDLDAEVIAELTEDLLENTSFIYKRMENLDKVSNMNLCLPSLLHNTKLIIFILDSQSIQRHFSTLLWYKPSRHTS